MSSTRPSWCRQETLQAIPLHKPLSIKVLGDVGGVTIFGEGEWKGYVAAGLSYEHALSVFLDGLLSDYYEYSMHPAEVQTAEDSKRAALLRGLFWKRGMRDVDNVEVRR